MTRKPWFWPSFVVGILVLGVGVNLAFMIVANADPSFAVEQDYYDKAIAWDDRRAQDAANEALGWSLDFAAIGARGGADRPTLELTVAVRNRDGDPLDDARVRVETFPIARSADVDRAILDGAGDGLYRAALPLRHAGLWEFRFEVERGDARFTSRDRREVVSP